MGIKQRGFTIVELLIVIVVIGILAALVVGTFTVVQERGRNTARVQAAKTSYSSLRTAASDDSAIPSFATSNAASPLASTAGVITNTNSTCLGEGYPNLTGSTAGDCFRATSGANYYTSENPTVLSWLKTHSSQLPSISVPPLVSGSATYGGPILLREDHTVGGGPVQSYIMYYVLEGNDTQCGLSTLDLDANASPMQYSPSATGYTRTGFGTTTCKVSLQGIK